MDEKAPCMKVKCGVANCVFNEEYMCHAEALEVNSTRGHHAHISDDTICTTFKDEK